MNFDWSVLYFIQEHITCGFLDSIFPIITALGNNGYIWIAIGVIMIISKKYRKHGVILLLGLLAGLIIGNLCIKNLVMRDRPCWLDPSVALLIPSPHDFSFPSGHTLSGFIAAAVLAQTDRRFGIAAFVIAVIIAFSRLYLFVHFPTDVLAGAVLGIIIGIAVFRISSKLLKVQNK